MGINAQTAAQILSKSVIVCVILLALLSVAVVEVVELESRLSTDASTISQLKNDASHPTLTIWTKSLTLNSAGWLVEGVPDSFDFSVSFNSTVPVTLYFLSFAQFVQFVNSHGSISSVSGQYQYYPATMSLKHAMFTLAEACAGYVSVFQFAQGGTIFPNVIVTYNPSLSVTGVCASNS